MDLVIAGGVAVASLIPIFRLQRDITSIQNTLLQMNGLPTFSPGEVLHMLKSGQDALKYFKESQDGETLSGKVFLQGRIDVRYPVKSVLVERDLIHRKLYVDNIYSNDRGSKIIKNNSKRFMYFTDKNNKQVITESSPYMDLYNFSETQNLNSDSLKKDNINPAQQIQANDNLSNSSSNNNQNYNQISVRILKNIQANYKYALQLIEIKRHFKDLNFAENAVIIFSFIIEFIVSMLQLKILRSRGIKVGYQEVEYGIPIRTLITVFGELIFNKKNGKMIIKKPEYFFNSDARLRNDLKNKIQNKRVLLVLLFLPLIFSSGYLYQRLYKIITAFIRKQRQKKDDLLKKMARLDLDNLSCKVCNENVRNIIFKPCHHMTHCKQCFENMLRERNIDIPSNINNVSNPQPNNQISQNISSDLECSICKQHVTSTVEVFVSQSGCFAPNHLCFAIATQILFILSFLYLFQYYYYIFNFYRTKIQKLQIKIFENSYFYNIFVTYLLKFNIGMKRQVNLKYFSIIKQIRINENIFFPLKMYFFCENTYIFISNIIRNKS